MLAMLIEHVLAGDELGSSLERVLQGRAAAARHLRAWFHLYTRPRAMGRTREPAHHLLTTHRSIPHE